ncbi:MAG: ATP-binding protein [Planctomycetaceae bacterium]|nr:ATP-binding protein [Planctomycetaceae bacterium]
MTVGALEVTSVLDDAQRQMLDSVPVGLCLLAADSTVLAWNRTLVEWTGLSARDAIQRKLTDLFPSLLAAKYAQRLAAVFTTGAPAAFSAALHHHFIPAKLRNDERLMVQETSIRLISRNPLQALVTIQDVTLASRQLECLRQERKKLLEATRALEVANESLQESFEDASTKNYQLNDEIQERRRIEVELREQTLNLIEAKAREAEHTSQLEQLVRDLTAARQQAHVATQAKSDFLANMSHEIRTPMTAILGYMDMLHDPDFTAEQRQQVIQTVHRNGEHLLAIINDVLDLSKIEAGKMTIERVETAPRELIRDIIELMSGRAKKQKLGLLIEMSESIPPRLLTDPTRLQQILVNLIGNAIKFTSLGSVTLSVDWLDCQQKEGILRIQVTDTGIGIADHQLKNLFQPFTQADSGTARQFGGTGLGLAISRRLAMLMGGELSVESQQGVGSTFTLTVTCGRCLNDTVNHRVGSSHSGPVALSLENVHVLVADDSPDNQKLLAYNLRKVGATFEVAGNGLIALEMIEAARLTKAFDVVLMDIQMPLLDGYAATRQLRERKDNTPVIALTANAMTGDHEKCLNAGCNDYLTKPINREKLIATIARWAKTPVVTVD